MDLLAKTIMTPPIILLHCEFCLHCETQGLILKSLNINYDS